MQAGPDTQRGRSLIAGAFGASALVVQTEYLRGAMVVSDGGAVAIGAALAAWLAVICAGSLAGTLLDRRLLQPKSVLYGVGILALPAAVFLLFHLVSFRQSIGLTAGLIAPPVAVFSRCLVSCLPYCFCIGLSFPLISSLLPSIRERGESFSISRILGSVWAAEALGAFLAGLVFTFVLAGRTSPVSNVMFFGALPLLALIASAGQKRITVWISTVATLCALLSICLLQPLTGRFADLEWQALGTPGRPVSSEWSRYGSLILAESEGQYTLFENGTPRAVFPDAYSDLSLVALVLCQSPGARQVIVAGPCCGGLAQALLRTGVDSVMGIYPDRSVEELITGHLPDSLRLDLEGGGYSYISADARTWLGRKPAPGRGARTAGNEVLFIDLPGPSRMESSRYYTGDFFRLAARAFGPSGGLLVLRLPYAASYSPGPRLDLAASVWASLGRTFHYRALAAGATELFLFATDQDSILSQDPDRLMQRLESLERKISGFSRYYLSPYFESDRVDAIRYDLEARSREAPANMDRTPVAWFQHLRLDLRLSGGEHGSILEKIMSRAAEISVARRVLIATCPVTFCLVLLGVLIRKGFRKARPAAAVFSLVLAGMASLGGMVILQYTCQLVFGALFQQIGLLTAVFMLALAVGSHLSAGMTGTETRGRIILEISLGVLAVSLVLAAGLPYLLEPLYLSGSPAGGLSYLIFYLAVAFTGFFGGAVFPAVARECHPTGSTMPAGVTAGLLNAADHCGAALGAFLVGVVVLPAWGLFSSSSSLALALACSVLFWIWLRIQEGGS